MIVKILYNKSVSFPGISYNTNKMEKDKGELLKVSGFGALQGLDNLRPSDYVNYLEALSARSKRTRRPQLHAMISCKGRSHTKEQLTAIGEQWLKGMGYGEQPYLLVYHKDTDNNHIHMVTTRVGKDGKKISDSFEKLKAYQVLNQIIKADEHLATHPDLENALSYNFSTRAQFMMILEAQGYTLTPEGASYRIIKYGRELARLPMEKVDERIAAHQKNKERIIQLRAIIERYRQLHDPSLQPLTRPLPGGREQALSAYTSPLAEMLRKKIGLEVIFHAKDGKQPYGYTFIDHAKKQVFKGNEVMELKEFITPAIPVQQQAQGGQAAIIPAPENADQNPDQSPAEKNQAAPSLTQKGSGAPDYRQEPHELLQSPVPGGFQLDLAEDIDDEAINGRNRRRKRKARTNTR
ncbi:Relaxase/Mobilisation nuclease domain-containing protein [Mucilaginibacter pineti]|uniref:Relaxase/Mobilisation nuclease domain-containing protein n=1 Tax=Mucilaginibacter pineti TaxID=1391627 RepID=A0A1G7IH37_9SPHI|nr:relaxase/mobilization nuclease domain-containing protein [Mucilaginibacter pineti]SDF11834.1 Relaxase/Mobilisation nuclease domain-containing protein [Mucilaginibacter pineti]